MLYYMYIHALYWLYWLYIQNSFKGEFRSQKHLFNNLAWFLYG